MKKVSRYGYRYRGVSLDPVSKTIPDQNLSVEEILRRFTTGILTPVEMDRQHAYGSDIAPDEDEDNLRPEYDPDFDLVDAYELAQQADRLKTQLQQESKRSKKASIAKEQKETPQEDTLFPGQQQDTTSNAD